jgi:iron(III) transport system substrate-binding protein
MEQGEQLRGDRRVSRRGFVKGALGAGLALPGMAGLLAACAPASAPAKPAESKPPAAQPAATAPVVGKPADKPANLDQIVEAAKREGELHWIDVTVQQFNDDKFHNAFKQKYGLPDSFRLRHTLKGTGDVVTQVQQEVQAGNVTLDFVWIGDLAFWQGLDQAGALLDYSPTELGALDAMVKRLGFPTGQRWWTITSYCFAPTWNKQFVKKDIKSWNDLIDPDFKDKAIQGDIRTSSTQTDTYIGLKKVIGTDWFQRYQEVTNPVLIFRTPEQQQKLTSGERIITNFQITARALQAQREDSSLSFGAAFPTEGVVPLPIQGGILAKAPHPNAAKLWAEFVTSKEGQQLWVDEEAQWPLRTDATYSEEVKEFLTPLDQVKAITLDWEKEITPQARDEARAEFRRIFKVN